MADKIYVTGFRAFPKHEKAPDFVLGTLVISLDDFKAFVNGEAKQYLSEYKGKKQLKIQVTKGKEGGLVFAVDTWKAEAKAEPTFEDKINDDEVPSNNAQMNDDGDDLPF